MEFIGYSNVHTLCSWHCQFAQKSNQLWWPLSSKYRLFFITQLRYVCMYICFSVLVRSSFEKYSSLKKGQIKRYIVQSLVNVVPLIFPVGSILYHCCISAQYLHLSTLTDEQDINILLDIVITTNNLQCSFSLTCISMFVICDEDGMSHNQFTGYLPLLSSPC